MADEPQVRLPSLAELEATYEHEFATDRWAAAETAYALAVRCRDDQDPTRARAWAQKSIDVLRGFPSDTLGQVATRRTSVGGVTLPDYLHDGVIKARFSDLLD